MSSTMMENNDDQQTKEQTNKAYTCVQHPYSKKEGNCSHMYGQPFLPVLLVAKGMIPIERATF
eukprot:12475206-Ditylum_brightwellii.AAC.1